MDVHETKNGLAIVAALLGLLAYIPYIRDTIKRKTRPHAFSWLTWGTMAMVAFFAQVGDGAGAGSWALAFTALSNYFIFVLALSYGERTITKTDWLSLMAAFIGLGLWINEDPPLSLFIISSVYVIGFIPTVRKSLLKPHQETATTYIFTTLKYVVTIVALERFSLVTLIYPIAAGFMNAFFVGILSVRRVQMGFGFTRRLRPKNLKRRKLLN